MIAVPDQIVCDQVCSSEVVRHGCIPLFHFLDTATRLLADSFQLKLLGTCFGGGSQGLSPFCRNRSACKLFQINKKYFYLQKL